jgi:hypothetical protein
VTVKVLIPNYIYGATINSFNVSAANPTYNLTTPILITDGGYGGFQVTGQIVSATDSSPIAGA